MVTTTLYRIARSVLAHVAGGLALSVALMSAAATPAFADASPEIRWSVAPADALGPDGRRSAEFTLAPGESAQDHLAVRNVSAHTVEFGLAASDGFFTSTGRFDTLPSDQESVDAGTWISLPSTVPVGPGETVVVPYTLTVPERAQPGDHAAGITASVVSTQQSDDGTSVGVESRVGFRVMTRVTGELAPAARLDIGSLDYTTSWNPLRPGAVTVRFDVSNSGNTILFVQGMIAAGTTTVPFPADDEKPAELLPADSRTFSVRITDVWPTVIAPAKVTITPVALSLDGVELAVPSSTIDIQAWAIPWPQLAVLLGVGLVVSALVWGRRTSRRRLEALLAGAHERGRRSASVDSSS